MRRMLVVVLGLLVLAAAGWLLIGRPAAPQMADTGAVPAAGAAPAAVAATLPQDEAGSVSPVPPAAPAPTAAAAAADPAPATRPQSINGVPVASTHLIPEQPYAEEQLASAQNLQTAEDYARFHPGEAPPPFDAEAFAADPAAYLRIADSRRIWQMADSASGLPALVPEGETLIELAPGARIQLAVQTAPGAPATFNSSGLGAFANGLSTVSVQADAAGVARTWFTITPGTSGEVPITVASPLRQGQVQFSVLVDDPFEEQP